MIRKITAAALAVLILISMATVAAFAVSEKSKEPVIYFDAKTSQWEDESQIYCHIFAYNGDSFFEWQTKKERCTDQKDGTWMYDLAEKEITLKDDTMYCVMFSSSGGKETYQIFFDPSCYEDTVCCTGEKTENPVDSQKSSELARWKNADNTLYGPVLAITSLGNVVGTACAPDTTPSQMLIGFLKDTLDNARVYTAQDDQTIIDHLKDGLSLSDDEVAKAIEASGVEVDWQPESPATPDEPTKAPTQAPTIASTGILGDVDGDGVVSVLDASLIQKYKAKFIPDGRIDLSVADVDGDGDVSVMDATRIQKYKAGLCGLNGAAIKSYVESLNFNAASAGWKNTASVGFHIRDLENERDITALGAEEEKGDSLKKGVWSIDLESIGVELEEGKQYGVTFYNAEGDSTYEMTFDTTCFKDIAKCAGEKVGDQPVAYWQKQDPAVNGPIKAITSSATVVGTCIPKGQTPYLIFERFLRSDYQNALSRTGKSSQDIIDSVSEKIGLSYRYEVSVAIAESGVSVSWDTRYSPLPIRAEK